VDSSQKLTIYKLFILFASMAMLSASFFGYLMYRSTTDLLQQQLLINTLFAATIISIFTGVSTLVIGIADLRKEDVHKGEVN